jgi:hypothetical protein
MEDLLIEGLHLCFQELQMPEGMANQEALMIGEAMTGDRGRDRRDLHSGLLLGQLRDLLCAQMAIEQCLEHKPAGYTEDIRQNVPQLDVCILEDLLHAIALAGVLPNQLPAPTGQIPQFADSEGRDEAWRDHSVTEKMGQSAAVIRIGLVPVPVLHIGSVGKNHPDVCLKQIEDRLPLAPRTLHHGVGATPANQPGGKPVELTDDGAKLLDLRPWFVLGAAGHHADQHELLAIDAGTPLNHCFDQRSSLRTSSRRRSGHIVLRAQKRHQSGVHKPPAGQIIIRVKPPISRRPFLPVRKGILSARRTPVKTDLLIRRCGRSAAMTDYHA